MKRFCILLAGIVTLCAKAVDAADVSYMNERIGQAVASDSCEKTTFWTMLAAQTYDYITSYRNFEHGYVETDPINRQFTQAVRNTKIGLALGFAAVDTIGLRLTQRSPVLRCAFQSQRTGASINAAIHNNAIGREYRP